MGRLGMCLLLFFLTATSGAEARTFKLSREGKFVACKGKEWRMLNWAAELRHAAQLASYTTLVTVRARPVVTPTPTPTMTSSGREFQG